jgi:hypothetical protein
VVEDRAEWVVPVEWVIDLRHHQDITTSVEGGADRTAVDAAVDALDVYCPFSA